MRIINNLFLSIGAMKAGTTWSFAQLRQHPDIYFTPEKELHFFAHHAGYEHHFSRAYRYQRFLTYLNKVNPDNVPLAVLQYNIRWYTDFLMNLDKKRWYPRVFDHRKHEKYCADFSNLNALLEPEDWKFVQETTENLKVLFTLREPLDRLWSHMRFHNAQSGLNLDLENMSFKALVKYAFEDHFQQASDYVQTVQSLQDALPERDYKITFFEHIHDNPTQWLQEIEEFLEISHHDYDPSGLSSRVNQSRSSEIPKDFANYMQEHFAGQKNALNALGLNVKDVWT